MINNETVSLREYIDTKIASVEKATEVAKESVDERLKGMNEFRDALKDQAARFTTREELGLVIGRLEQDIKNLQVTRGEMVTTTAYEATHKDVQKQVDELRLSRANLEGRASQASVYVAFAIAASGIILGVINLLK